MTLNRITAVFAATALCMCLMASSCQNTLVALTSTFGNAGASIAAIEGNTDLATKIQTDTATAVMQIQAWKSGSDASMAVEAIQLVEDDMNLLPINSKYEPLILLALGTAASIIAILNPGAATVARINGQSGRRVGLGNPPKNAGQFKAQWNTICKANPALAGAELR